MSMTGRFAPEPAVHFESAERDGSSAAHFKTITKSLYCRRAFASEEIPRRRISLECAPHNDVHWPRRLRAVSRPLASAASTVPMSRPW
jgi:hypothetical protein